jgi:hypothetical protein
MKLCHLNRIGITTQPKPLLFRGGVGVGSVNQARRLGRNPTLLRLDSKLPSLTAPPLKRRG